MRALIAIGLVGCFSPSPPAGAPCDPAAPSCPGDQACTASAGGFFCGVEPTAVDAQADTTVAVDTPTVDASLLTHFELPADIAECVDPANPSPSFCRSSNGGGGKQMVVDIVDSQTGDPWFAYIRFAADNTFAGKTIQTVKLRVVTTNDPLAAGDSGEVFAVVPFSLADLDTTAPAKMGARLALSKGNVPAVTTVDFTLPVATVTAGTATYLGIFPKGGSGVNYWNIDGTTPPRLVIDTN